MKPRPFALGKIFSKESYGRSFLNGEIYISQLATFGIGKLLKGEEVLDKHRDDFNEGLRVNLHTSDNMPLEQVVTFFSDIGGIPKDANAIGEIDSRFISENISCYTALFFDSNAGEYMKPNAELTKFQDADDGNKGIAIIIHDVSELLKRVFTVLSSALGSQYWAAYGLVDYSFSSSKDDYVDEFTKEENYSYQDEFRLAIKLLGKEILLKNGVDSLRINPDGSIVLNIGSLSDITFLLSIEDYINLKYPIEHQTIMHKEPCIVGSFYPPVLNEISYVFPLVRTKNRTFIAVRGMYPIIRKEQTYSINSIRLAEMRTFALYNRKFLTEIMDIYFSRLLDICKSTGHEKMMFALLDAIVHFLILLNIEQCAGVRLSNDGFQISASYQGLEIHDESLKQTNKYRTIKKESGIVIPTDFAELVSLSEQDHFDEYEYEGNRYVRILVSKDGVLTSGKKVTAGDAVWVEVSKVIFRGC